MSLKRTPLPASPALEAATKILIPTRLDRAAVGALVRERLQQRCWPGDRPIPIWSRIEADLEAAEENALVGITPPADPQAHGLRGLVKGILVKWVLRLARPITRPQGLFNTSILRCLDAVMAWAYTKEEGSALVDRVASLEQQIAQQEDRLRELEQLLLNKQLRKLA